MSLGWRRAGGGCRTRAGRDRLPPPKRGGRRVGAPTRGAGGTRDVPRGLGRAARRRPRTPRDLFGKRGLPRPSGAARATARARDNDRRARRCRFSYGREGLGVRDRGGLFGGL